MRLFFGIGLPERLRSEVGRLQSLLRPAGADVRWAEPGHAHFTLAFLGEVAPEALGEVDGAARSIAPPPAVSVELRGLGAFPARGPIRVLWAGIDAPPQSIGRLHESLAAELCALGFGADRRPYRPHVTLGRVRGRVGQAALRRLLVERHDLRIGSWRVDRFALFRSRLSPRGPRYEILAEYPLGGVPPSGGTE